MKGQVNLLYSSLSCSCRSPVLQSALSLERPLVQAVPVEGGREVLVDDEGQLLALLEVEPVDKDLVRGRIALVSSYVLSIST